MFRTNVFWYRDANERRDVPRDIIRTASADYESQIYNTAVFLFDRGRVRYEKENRKRK